MGCDGGDGGIWEGCRGRERAEDVSKNARSPLHLPDGLSAEASEGVGRDSLDTAVLLDVPAQHRQTKAGYKHTAAQ